MSKTLSTGWNLFLYSEYQWNRAYIYTVENDTSSTTTDSNADANVYEHIITSLNYYQPAIFCLSDGSFCSFDETEERQTSLKEGWVTTKRHLWCQVSRMLARTLCSRLMRTSSDRSNRLSRWSRNFSVPLLTWFLLVWTCLLSILFAGNW